MREFSCEAHLRFTVPGDPHARLALRKQDDHENSLTTRGVRPYAAALVAAGVVGAALAIGAMTLLLSPQDPRPVSPIELGPPAASDRGDERRERQRRAERRERLRRQAARRAARRARDGNQAPVAPGGAP